MTENPFSMAEALAETSFRDAEPGVMTEESFLDLVAGMILTTEHMPVNTIMMSVPMANRIERGWRWGDACRVLHIAPDSAKARRVTVRRDRWPA